MTQVTSKQKLVVHILPEAYALVRKMVEVSSLECSMLGEVEQRPEPGITFLITKIFIPFQTRSATETTIDSSKLPEVIESEQIDNQKVKCWFHSHVNMAPHPSGQDEIQIKELMNDADWFIRGIFNKKNEYTLSVHWMGLEIEAILEIKYSAQTLTDAEATKLLSDRTTSINTYSYETSSRRGVIYSGENDDFDRFYPYRGVGYSSARTKKNKKKIKRLSFADFKSAFTGKGKVEFLNYLKNNENDFELLEDLEEEQKTIDLQPEAEETVWQTA